MLGERAVCPEKCLGGRTLKKRPRLRVHRRADEVVRRGIANIELDGGIERRELHQIRRAMRSRFNRRLGRQCLGAKLGHGAHRRQSDRLSILALDWSSWEHNTADPYFSRVAVGTTLECEPLPVIEPGRRELELRYADLSERIIEEPLDQCVKASIALE